MSIFNSQFPQTNYLIGTNSPVSTNHNTVNNNNNSPNNTIQGQDYYAKSSSNDAPLNQLMADPALKELFGIEGDISPANFHTFFYNDPSTDDIAKFLFASLGDTQDPTSAIKKLMDYFASFFNQSGQYSISSGGADTGISFTISNGNAGYAIQSLLDSDTNPIATFANSFVTKARLLLTDQNFINNNPWINDKLPLFLTEINNMEKRLKVYSEFNDSAIANNLVKNNKDIAKPIASSGGGG